MKDPQAINDYLIKLSGKAALPEPLDIGYNYKIEAEGAIVSMTETDRDDGGRVFLWKFEPVLVRVVKEGKTIKAKDTRRRSQQLRSALFKQWRDNNEPKEFEDYYDEEMLKIIRSIIGNY